MCLISSTCTDTDWWILTERDKMWDHTYLISNYGASHKPHWLWSCHCTKLGHTHSKLGIKPGLGTEAELAGEQEVVGETPLRLRPKNSHLKFALSHKDEKTLRICFWGYTRVRGCQFPSWTPVSTGNLAFNSQARGGRKERGAGPGSWQGQPHQRLISQVQCRGLDSVTPGLLWGSTGSYI